MTTQTVIARITCPKTLAGRLRTACTTSLLPLLLLALPAVVQAQFTYTTTNGTITITRFIGPGGAVTIPDTIGGWPVTSIGESAFWECYSLTSITIPNSVTSLGDLAFGSCYFLTNVTLGNSVINIGSGAFELCNRLKNITIPNSVSSIGVSAFNGCTSLTNVTIGTNVTSIGSFAFCDCWGLTSVMIPSGVTNIGPGVFEGCTRLPAITVDVLNPVYSVVAGVLFNKNQTTLNEYPAAKAGTSYTIPDSVTIIGNDAFNWCISLTSITIPNSVTSIGESAFFWCNGLTNITIGSSVTSIGANAFGYCSSLSNITIGDSVTTIGGGAFAYCDGLTNVTSGNSVTLIDYAAFAGCFSLTGVYFEGDAPSLGGSSVFENDSKVTVYYLPGTTGWGTTFGGRPTALWFLPNPVILDFGPSFGVKTNGFGFIISWATNVPVVVEASTNLANPIWSPVATNILTSGSSYFSDPQSPNSPARFYRIRSP